MGDATGCTRLQPPACSATYLTRVSLAGSRRPGFQLFIVLPFILHVGSVPRASCLGPFLFLQTKRSSRPTKCSRSPPTQFGFFFFFEGYALTELLSQFLRVLIYHMPDYQLENEIQVWFNIYFLFSLSSRKAHTL